MGVTVEVTDQYGGYIRSRRNIVTDFIDVVIYNGRTDEKTFLLLDPKDAEDLKWLKSVYPPGHLSILLA